MNRPTWTHYLHANQLEGAKQILAKSLEPHLTLPARFTQDILLVNSEKHIPKKTQIFASEAHKGETHTLTQIGNKQLNQVTHTHT